MPGSTEVEVVKEANSVVEAARSGDLDALKKAIAAEPRLVNEPDDKGHYPLQWASLNNYIAVVEALLAADAAVNATNQEGNTALHWAVTRNALPCMEALLRAGAEKEARNSKGYRPVHIAGQYGHTAALYHIVLRWDADFDAKDNEGRTALHWSAYRGFHNLVRLLLVLGCSSIEADDYGHTPLHYAASLGNSEACTILLQAGGLDCLTATTQQGNTAEKLALDNRHRLLAAFLRTETRILHRKAQPRPAMVKLLQSLHFAPVIWIATLTSIAVFYSKVLNPSVGGGAGALQPWMVNIGAVMVLLIGAGLVLMAMVNVSDPGCIPTRSGAHSQRGELGSSSSDAHKGAGSSVSVLQSLYDVHNLDCPALWAGHWEQLCVTCRIVRPLRAKHDPYTGRCIEVFDHFCPWVGNAVGKGNHHMFVSFVLMLGTAVLLGYCVALGRLLPALNISHKPSWAMGSGLMWVTVWSIGNLPLLCTLVGLSCAQIMQALQNMTTNEMSNWPRYKHFRAPQTDPSQKAQFRNPFDRGPCRNLHELCCPSKYPMLPAILENNALAEMRLQVHNASARRSGCTWIF